MPAMNQRSMIVSTALTVVALAGCGGKGTKTTAPTNGGGDTSGSGLPFDPAAVQAALASAPGNAACGVEGSETFGDIHKRQGDALGTADQVDVSFACVASGADDGTFDCTWSVFSKPPAAPAADDPCGGECCSGFQIMLNVRADGTFAADTATCVAPG